MSPSAPAAISTQPTMSRSSQPTRMLKANVMIAPTASMKTLAPIPMMSSSLKVSLPAGSYPLDRGLIGGARRKYGWPQRGDDTERKRQRTGGEMEHVFECVEFEAE